MMKASRFFLLLLIFSALVGETQAKRILPGFEILIRHAELVVLCEWESRDGKFVGRVIDVWKGELNPAAFHAKTARGTIPVSSNTKREGQFVAFWNRHNQVFPGLKQVEVVPVTDGLLTRVLDRLGTKEEKTLKELRGLIKATPVERVANGPMPKLLMSTIRTFRAGLSLEEVGQRLKRAYPQVEDYGRNFRDSSGLTHFQIDERYLISIATRIWPGKAPVIHGDAFVRVTDRKGTSRATCWLVEE